MPINFTGMLPFSPPHIFPESFDEMADTLNSGWITTGPKTKLLETELASFAGVPKVICLNSATAGLELMLRWFGVQAGDEVIIPAYTYCATANVVVHCGATPIMAEASADDFNIDPTKLAALITPRTKAIMPVDIGGLPCDYNAIMKLVCADNIRSLFIPHTENQKDLGRIMVLSDAAHSLGAVVNNKRTGTLCDATVFSFHAVKNLTTAEGGAVALNLPAPFDNIAIYAEINTKSLHGQSKDALAKLKKGSWEYDVVEPGYKYNMPDIIAALGLAGIRHYASDILPRSKHIVDLYHRLLAPYSWTQCPITHTGDTESSYHLYMLRIRGISEQQRNVIISRVFDKEVSVNVHFKPLPLMTYYKNAGYNMADYPVAYDNYSREITLPVYYDLTDEQVAQVTQAVVAAYNETMHIF
jgi:dTDP-4-amino-4,6-dideoxygalactose transaminase